MRIQFLLLLLVACELPEIVERDCDERWAYYPDENGDGLGEPSDVFIGCKAPDGWVDVLGPPITTYDTDTAQDTDTDSETGDTAGDTGADTAGDTADTADTADDTLDTANDTAP